MSFENMPNEHEARIAAEAEACEGFIEGVELTEEQREVFESFLRTLREGSDIFASKQGFWDALEGINEFIVDSTIPDEVRDAAGMMFAIAADLFESLTGDSCELE